MATRGLPRTWTTAAIPNPAASSGNCADGIDNDGDTFKDCVDFADCVSSTACNEFVICEEELDINGNCPMNQFANGCTDGIDNNGDGLIDCADPSCAAYDQSCTTGGLQENCTVFGDEDMDGLFDCADPVCFLFFNCRVTEDCSDGIDNNNDNATDCADSECLTSDDCNELVCDDMFDDDGNGLEDCDDPDCWPDPNCNVSTCCYPNAGMGCDDPLGTSCACVLDPACCGDNWSETCALLYTDVCGGTCP